MATEPKSEPSPAALIPGLTPFWSAIAQFGAIALMGFMFWQSQQAWFTQVKEDRAMVQRESDRMWQAIRDSQRSTEDLARGVRDDQTTTKELMHAIKDLTIEVRKTQFPPKP